MGAGLAGGPPCLPQSGLYGDWVRWETSLSTTQSGPYGCWVSWETSLSTTQSGLYGCWVSWETSLSTTQSGPYGCWVSWETSLSTTQSGPYGDWVSWETSLSTTVRSLWMLGYLGDRPVYHAILHLLHHLKFHTSMSQRVSIVFTSFVL